MAPQIDCVSTRPMSVAAMNALKAAGLPEGSSSRRPMDLSARNTVSWSNNVVNRTVNMVIMRGASAGGLQTRQPHPAAADGPVNFLVAGAPYPIADALPPN